MAKAGACEEKRSPWLEQGSAAGNVARICRWLDQAPDAVLGAIHAQGKQSVCGTDNLLVIDAQLNALHPRLIVSSWDGIRAMQSEAGPLGPILASAAKKRRLVMCVILTMIEQHLQRWETHICPAVLPVVDRALADRFLDAPVTSRADDASAAGAKDAKAAGPKAADAEAAGPKAADAEAAGPKAASSPPPEAGAGANTRGRGRGKTPRRGPHGPGSDHRGRGRGAPGRRVAGLRH
jgi:hypothetical protein